LTVGLTFLVTIFLIVGLGVVGVVGFLTTGGATGLSFTSDELPQELRSEGAATADANKIA